MKTKFRGYENEDGEGNNPTEEFILDISELKRVWTDEQFIIYLKNGKRLFSIEMEFIED